MNIYICLPNDGEFEFEADVTWTAGTPAKLFGPPESCYPEEPAEVEFNNYGPFVSMLEAVYAACWINDCPMTIEAMEKLADKVEQNIPEPEEEYDYDYCY